MINAKAHVSSSIGYFFLILIAAPLILISCGGNSTPAGNEKYSFVYNNVEITPGDDIAPIVKALGEPSKYYEAASCAFNGLDKMYTYGSVQINTYPDGGCDKVLSIVILDDANMTPEGITIGSEKEKVIAAYGTDYEGGDTSLIYKKGGTELKFILRDGCVTSIQYYDVEASGS
jgi:hypothetical protein